MNSKLRSADTAEVVRSIREAVARDPRPDDPGGAVAQAREHPEDLQRQDPAARVPGRLPGGQPSCRRRLREGEREGQASPEIAGGDVVQAGSGPPGRSSAEAIETWLTLLLAERLKVPAIAIDPRAVRPIRARLGDGGPDLGRLQERLARRLSPTVMYDYPSVRSLATHLAGESRLGSETMGDSRPLPAAGEPIAVVGIGCRLPGAKNPAEFWRLLRDGVDAVSYPAASRGAASGLAGEVFPSRGGFLEDVDLFDADFFGISPREAEVMDPQHRLLLEVAWEALEDAGEAAALAGRRAGVFVGISTTTTPSCKRGTRRGSDRFAGTGNALSIAANRLSYFLDLRGPSMAVDTACSSSLVAVASGGAEPAQRRV